MRAGAMAAKFGAKAARRETVRQASRRAILDGLRNLLARGGMEALNVRAVASLAGYSAGALYLYFPTLDHLMAEAAVDSLTRLDDACRRAMMRVTQADEQGRRVALYRCLRRPYDYFVQYPHEYTLIVHVLSRTKNKSTQQAFGAIANSLAAGIAREAGVVRQEGVARAVALVAQIMALHLMGDMDADHRLDRAITQALQP